MEPASRPAATSRKTWIVGGVIVVMLLLVAKSHFDRFMLRLRIAWALDQVQIFEIDCTNLQKATPLALAARMEDIVTYYPSGTKQVEGSQLDRVVEGCRRSACRVLMAELRCRTGLDLGDDPQTWIEHFRSAEKPSDPNRAADKEAVKPAGREAP
jgi:hypothetical protein